MMCLYYKDILVDTNIDPYLNIQCGKDSTGLDLDMIADNTGDNISKDNLYWSEITGLYWAWKNIEKSKYVGLCSYRRFFNFKEGVRPVEICSIEKAKAAISEINYEQLDEIFKKSDVILPVPYTYPWSISRVCSKNYRNEDYDILEAYIKSQEPDYHKDYLEVMRNTNEAIGHNMFIMRWSDFQDYCGWVFGILGGISKEIDPRLYPIHQSRVFGYMHELLLAVYVRNKQLNVHRSQILWVNDEIQECRFNKFHYRMASKVVYSLGKLLGNYYPHRINR